MGGRMPIGVDVAGTGFTVLDRVYAGDSPLEALGGSCGNVLISLAMLRRSVVPIIALGQDAVGDRLVSTFIEAGANVRYIVRRHDIASPVLVQRLDLDSGRHWFVTICPDTNVEFPRYTSIELSDVHRAREVIDHCSVFYADRVSEAIVDAMEAAASSGALVYFEPSVIDDTVLFERALHVTKILKYASGRLSDAVSAWLGLNAISIITHGAEGLEVRQGTMQYRRNAVQADVVRDTCGSGDMVSVGLIDWLLSRRSAYREWDIDDVLAGVVAGQRLAAVNCAYPGARGLFERRGAAAARAILDGA